MKQQTDEEFTYLNTKHGKTRYILDGPTDGVDHVIVFVCGISAHSYSYFNLMKEMRKQFSNSNCGSTIQYLRYDKYGRGKSDNPNVEHSADLFVEQLYELMDEVIIKKVLKRPRITLVGFSMGGCISIHFSAKYSNLVDDLILFSPAGGTWKLPFGSSIVTLPWVGNIVFGAIHKLTTEEQKMASGFFDLNDEMVKDRITYAVDMKTKENEQGAQVSSFVNSLTYFPLQGSEKQVEIIGKSNMRILLIWSIFDMTIPSDECFPTFFKLLKVNNKSRFVILNNTRHTFFMEREQDTAQMMVNFLVDSTDEGTIQEKFERTVNNVKKQEPKRDIMTSTDTYRWEFFESNEEYKELII